MPDSPCAPGESGYIEPTAGGDLTLQNPAGAGPEYPTFVPGGDQGGAGLPLPGDGAMPAAGGAIPAPGGELTQRTDRTVFPTMPAPSQVPT
ncbi:MAG: hypothetical protein A2V98_17680 [Planctomycetes bacterium RBG_16_64_12]|nr:MAG: hypothetical protein A2V98_17680 [Planctomycetes bacterium RBG_16_64_12]